MSSVHAAAQAGQASLLVALVRRGGQPCAEVVDKDGATPVHFAAAKGRAQCLWWMLTQGGATGNERDGIDATPVHDAAEQGQLRALKILAHCGADLSIADGDGLTPRKLALEGGHSASAQFLATASTRLLTGQLAHELSDEEVAELQAGDEGWPPPRSTSPD
jgi:ankyrin repeat protein